MKEKYITEQYPKWFEHGGTIIGNETQIEHCLPTLPESAIQEHNRTVDKLVEVTMLLFKLSPQQAKDYWYNDRN